VNTDEIELPPGIDLDAFKRWTPAAQERALEALKARSRRTWRPFWCPNPTCNGKPHDEWTWNHARQDQRPPAGTDWLVWLLMSGRGSGKTRTGSEYIHRATAKNAPRVAIVAGTAPDARDTMIEGESGLLTIAKPEHRPVYEPSKRRLTWPNGAIGTVFSAEEPDRLRGPEHYVAWWDEPAHAPLVQEGWDNLMFGLRLGQHPRVICTSTPRPRPWLKALIREDTTRTVKASTYDNLDNLAPQFAKLVIAKYAGTRLGRQELFGELLEDVEGALWNFEMIEVDRYDAIREEVVRVVVAVDPAGSSRKTADETGIVAACRGRSGHLYVIRDRSGHYSPHGWAQAANALYEELSADAIVAETNYGGEMVSEQLRLGGFGARLITVHARRGKQLRAEPVVGLYEQHKVHHVGIHAELETQMTEWVPYETTDSPDRLDALVYALTSLASSGGVASISTPNSGHTGAGDGIPLTAGPAWQRDLVTGFRPPARPGGRRVNDVV
jgi:phage terminase large subunit-like protein